MPVADTAALHSLQQQRRRPDALGVLGRAQRSLDVIDPDRRPFPQLQIERVVLAGPGGESGDLGPRPVREHAVDLPTLGVIPICARFRPRASGIEDQFAVSSRDPSIKR